MAFNDFSSEPAQNYAQKCACVLVLDVSGSMIGLPIAELEKGIADFYTEIQNEPSTLDKLEVSIITFGSRVKHLQAPTLLHNKKAPELVASGSTVLVDGVRAGIAQIEARKNWYKETGQAYYRPWLVLITDGAPEEDQDVTGLIAELKADMETKKYSLLTVGVAGADMEILSQLARYSIPPVRLQGLKFVEFFKWLSASLGLNADDDDDDFIMENPPTWMAKGGFFDEIQPA